MTLFELYSVFKSNWKFDPYCQEEEVTGSVTGSVDRSVVGSIVVSGWEASQSRTYVKFLSMNSGRYIFKNLESVILKHFPVYKISAHLAILLA